MLSPIRACEFVRLGHPVRLVLGWGVLSLVVVPFMIVK